MTSSFAPRQNPHAGGGEQNQRVVFAVLYAFHFEIAEGAENGQCRGRDHHHVHEDAEKIVANQATVREALRAISIR